MLLNAFLNILGEPPILRGRNMRQIVEAMKSGADIKIVSFSKLKGKNYGISYRDKTGSHIIIPFHWNGPSSSITVNRALIYISKAQSE